MRFSVLSSGSKANVTFLEAGATRLLIDCGLSCRQTEIRLGENGIEPDTISALLLTHEHADHTRGAATFSKKYKVPVFANRHTAKKVHGCPRMRHFETGRSFLIADAEITPFSIPHDAADPVGFSVHSEGLKFSQVTDVGRITPLVRDALALTDALVIEFNHDPGMLWGCWYPWVLKQRIASSHGHCSNEDAAALVAEVWHPALQYIVLGHISENSNTPELAREALLRAMTIPLDPESLYCADPYHATACFELSPPKREVRKDDPEILTA